MGFLVGRKCMGCNEQRQTDNYYHGAVYHRNVLMGPNREITMKNSTQYIADKTELEACGMDDVVRNHRGTIICYAREADGFTAEEQAQRIASLLNGRDGHASD